MSFLNKNVFRSHTRPFGLDVSDLSLKLVWVEAEGKIDQVKSFGSVDLPQGAILDGEIVKPDIVIEALHALLAQAGPVKIYTNEVVCSLPEMKAFLRILALPPMSPAEVAEAIKWEIEGNIPLPLDQIYYDYQVLDRSFSREKNKMSVLMVAVAKTVVDQYVLVLKQAGLEVIALETESIAQARSLLSENAPEQTTLIVDLGDRRTSFLIAIGNIPVFTSSSPLSGQMITDAIAKSMHLSLEEAEQVKLTQGVGTSAEHNPLFSVAQPILDSLVVEIERSIDFYLGHLHYSSALDHIVLCGGGANLQGLLSYLSQHVHREIQFGNPWVNLKLGKQLPPIAKGLSVRYSTALGLSLRHMELL